MPCCQESRNDRQTGVAVKSISHIFRLFFFLLDETETIITTTPTEALEITPITSTTTITTTTTNEVEEDVEVVLPPPAETTIKTDTCQSPSTTKQVYTSEPVSYMSLYKDGDEDEDDDDDDEDDDDYEEEDEDDEYFENTRQSLLSNWDSDYVNFVSVFLSFLHSKEFVLKKTHFLLAAQSNS